MLSVGTDIAGLLVDFLGPKAAGLTGLLFFGVGNYLVAIANTRHYDVDDAL